MNYRVKLMKDNTYRVQYKTKFLKIFWNKWKNTQRTIGGYDGAVDVDNIFGTEKEAVEKMIEFLNVDVEKSLNSLSAIIYTPISVTYEELKAAFPEKFI